ncbi:MAG: transcription termination factor NusA [Planctomycetes bacterium]|nr:transcription termination factor NusA [Planctomycetota bacterium]
MNPNEILRIVDSLHRDKNIDPEIVFQAIEAALVTAAKRRYGEETEVAVSIARENGLVSATRNGVELATDEIETIGRIGAQSAKQVIIQKIREAERDSLIEEYAAQIGHMVNGIVQRAEPNAITVSVGTIEAFLPRSEQIPGESHHPNERVRAVICDVRPQGSRVRVVLSRTRPLLVQRLFEQEIPEIADGVIQVRAIAREPGYRSKVAVSSADQRVDCVGACVGVRGNRIKNIVDELASERIDIVRWNDDPKTLISNALQPAEVDQVLLCDMIGRAIVLVREDQLSLAIGRKGQNVRLASKLCGWDIEIMTEDELDEQIERAVNGFSQIDGMNEELAQRLVEQGYLSYDDLSVIEPDDLMEMGGLTAEQVDHIVTQAELKAADAEKAAEEERRRRRDEDRRAKAAEEASDAEASDAEASDAEASDAEASDAEATEPSEDGAKDGEVADVERSRGTLEYESESTGGSSDGSDGAPIVAEASDEPGSDSEGVVDERTAGSDR